MIWRLEDAITKLETTEAKELQRETAILEQKIANKFAKNNESYNG